MLICAGGMLAISLSSMLLQFARQKARELEDYQSLSLTGTGLEGEDEPAVKKRKIAKQVGFAGALSEV